MTTLLAGPGGEITDRVVEYYAARARGGAALITAETAEVHPYTHGLSLGDRGFTALYDDRFIPGFRYLTSRIHAAGAKASGQLHHPGNAMVMWDPSRPPVAPSAIPYPATPAGGERAGSDRGRVRGRPAALTPPAASASGGTEISIATGSRPSRRAVRS